MAQMISDIFGIGEYEAHVSHHFPKDTTSLLKEYHFIEHEI